MSADSPVTVLVADDDDRLRPRLARAFRDRGFSVEEASSAAEAIAHATRDSPELAVVDLKLGADNGLELVRALRAIDESTRIVVLTGYGSIATAVEAVRLGAVHYLTKPADADQLLAAFEGRTGEAAMQTEPASLARVEWEHIQRVLADVGGNISVAAKKLGLHRRSLQRKLGKMPTAR